MPSRRERLRLSAEPGSFTYELQMTRRQTLFRECCASLDEHRFDCLKVPPEQRGRGPFRPVTRRP